MDRKLIFLCAAAIPLGLVGGYAWSVLTAPASHAYVPPKATIADVPASPDELPEVSDHEWTARADDGAATTGTAGASVRTADSGVYYAGCNDVRAVGKAPLHSGDPGYRIEMDGDGDGIACEPYRGR